MSNRSRFFFALSTFVVVAMLSACSEPQRDFIRFGLATPPVNLDPRFATDATSHRVTRLLFDALVTFDDAFRPIPSLGTWRNETPRQYRFRLNRKAHFHDGRELTSQDVVATYRSILDRKTQSPHRASLSNIRSIEAPNANEIIFNLEKPDPLFPGLLVIGILSAKDLTHGTSPLATPVGSGPFAIEGEPNDRVLRLRRLRDGQIIEFTTIRDATVRALKLVHGEIDLMQGSMTPELVDWLDSRDGIAALHRPGTTFTYLGFNMDDEATGTKTLRRAIAHAIDREELTRYLFGGRARIAQAIFPPSHWAGDPSLEAVPHDPAKAKRLLAQLGYSETKRLRLSYKTSSDHFRLRLATSIQYQLSKVGIDIEISSYDWGTFYADIKSGRFQMYSLSWVGLKLPDIFRYVFHSAAVPPDGANRGRYRSAEVDRLIEAAENSTDIKRRDEYYAAIEENLLDDLPYVPLWYEDNIVVMRDSVVSYDTSMDGNYDQLATIKRTHSHAHE